jgi:6-phosphogluconate dehydrogenase
MAREELGVVGLGRMGASLALQAVEKGMRVVGFSKDPPPNELREAGVTILDNLGGFRHELGRPRAIFIYIPAGPAVDSVLDDLAAGLDDGDVLIDGGNSYWGDSIRRHRRMRERGIGFVDLGTSGGVQGARSGACFMAGGEDSAMARIEPVLTALAVPGGYVHAGPPGAGHFVKLVHNGIEFAMLQAIGEGVALLERYRDKLDVADVLGCWRHGSVIRGWLIDLMEEAYRAERGVRRIPSYVEDTGEVNWLVGDALHLEVPIPAIALSVMELFASRDGAHRHAARAIAMMRHGFGGHPYGPDEDIARERREGRIGGFYRGA